MTIIDAMGESKKEAVMKDTWGHLYPKPGKKYYGKMIVAVGQYGDQIIINSDFPGLESSPYRFHLEHSIFSNKKQFEPGVYEIKCDLWFFKNLNEGGKIINIETNSML